MITKRNTSTYAALQRAAIDVVAVKLTNGHSSVLVGVHLDESESTVRLETSLGNISKVLEKRNKIRLRSVGGQVADIASCLPLGSLRVDHIVALHTMGWEVVVSKGGRWCHAHGSHGLLLRDGRLALLVGPVAANGARSKPLAVHRAKRTLSISTITESDETVSARSTSLHVPHDAGLGNRTKGGESLQEDLIVDFVGQIADENVEMVGRVLLGGVVGLISPVDADFLVESETPKVASSCARLRCCECDGR